MGTPDEATIATGRFERVWQLAIASPGRLIEPVVHKRLAANTLSFDFSEHGSGTQVLASGGGKFEAETDKARLTALMVDQKFSSMGFLRAARQDGDWRFEFPHSGPCKVGLGFLKSIAGEIKKLPRAGTGKELRPA